MFSVVIITHNRPEELLRAVASVASQTVPPHEIVVVDDASSPPADGAALQSRAGPIPLRVVRHDTPRGPSGARNAGIEAASQEWIAFLDDDDEFDATKIEALRDDVAARPDSDLLYHPALILMVNEDVRYASQPVALPEGQAGFRALLVKNLIGGTSMVAARRQALREAGGFDEQLRAFEDYELWLRMARRGQRLRLLDRVLTRYYHVTRKRSVTKSQDAGMGAFSAIETRYQADYDSLTPQERRAHALWRYDTITHRAILNLRYGETLASVAQTLRVFRQPKYILILAAACLGPRFLIRLKARMARRPPAAASTPTA
jgi:glycosyltransferase involved in cell wall biosynthesis